MLEEQGTRIAAETAQPDVSQRSETSAQPEPLTGAALMESILDARERGEDLSAPAVAAGQSEDAEPPGDHADGQINDSGEGDYAPSEAERNLAAMAQSDPENAYEIGVAVLNQMPDLLRHNESFVLDALGYNSELAGVFYDLSEEFDWMQASLDPSLHETYVGLPADIREEMRSRPIEIARYELDNAAALDRYQNQRAEAAAAAARRREYETAKTLGEETRQILDEYVRKGRSLGLSELEAAGLAGSVYTEFLRQYWQDGSEWQTLFNDWGERVKGGNKYLAADGRKKFVAQFEKAYSKAAGRLDRGQAREPVSKSASNRNGPELMEDILRERGLLDD